MRFDMLPQVMSLESVPVIDYKSESVELEISEFTRLISD